MNRLLDLNNINARALVVPQEEGTDETDTYFGSIGDATNKHVSSLSDAERQLWEGLIVTKSGNIFRSQPSTNSFDPDPMNLRGKDLEDYFKKMKQQAGGKLDDTGLEAIREAFEAEAERREKSEDAYDRAELIPYDQWHKYPGMEKHLDIPTTPRDVLIYMGNVTRSFYDEFPEGHPDEKLINQVLMMVNRPDPFEIDEGYAGFVINNILAWRAKPYTTKYLIQMVESLVDCIDPNDVVADALLKIDDCWRIEFRNQCADRCAKDHVLQLLVHKEKEWEKLAEEGYTVVNMIKSFGQILFTNFRSQMSGYHWARYRRVRDKFAPRVVVRGKDINRCGIQDIQSSLSISRKDAEKIWYARPFNSLGELYHKGYINRNAFGDSAAADRVLSFIENQTRICKQKQDLSRFAQVGQEVVKAQRMQKVELDYSEWRMIWSYYRIMRDDLTRYINERKEENNEKA